MSSADDLATATASLPRSVKIILLGDSGAGKTSLLMRLSKGKFDPDIISTCGLDVVTKDMVVQGDTTVSMQVWDTAGQEQYHSISRQYYRSCHAVVLVFDLANIESFTNVHRWLRDIQSQMVKDDARSQSPLLLVGNKVDLGRKRAVGQDEARALAESVGVAYFETSAKTGHGVEDAFTFSATVAARFAAENPLKASTGLADINGSSGGSEKSRGQACSC
jgi:small GTP-binding protein